MKKNGIVKDLLSDEIISENELLTALQYLIEQGILVVDSN